ncbi:hypothetical protein PN499_00150 [Kamptonema animale CS-326]|nr:MULTISPECIES: hypothetical protein [Kamptonema]MDB9509616.1 hypothetical protein [Kamptonema animale CS-326]
MKLVLVTLYYTLSSRSIAKPEEIDMIFPDGVINLLRDRASCTDG